MIKIFGKDNNVLSDSKAVSVYDRSDMPLGTFGNAREALRCLRLDFNYTLALEVAEGMIKRVNGYRFQYTN